MPLLLIPNTENCKCRAIQKKEKELRREKERHEQLKVLSREFALYIKGAMLDKSIMVINTDTLDTLQLIVSVLEEQE